VKKYEGLFILNTSGKEEGIKEAIDKISAEITAVGGNVETVQKMDKRPFARVANKKHSSGFYVNFIFSAPNDAEFVPVQGEGEGLWGDGLVFSRQMEIDQPVSLPGLFLGRAEFEQEIITGQFLLLDLAQALPEPFQSAPAHRALLERPTPASRQDIKFSRLLDQFDLH
jgi:ribosomal protein S6